MNYFTALTFVALVFVKTYNKVNLSHKFCYLAIAPSLEQLPKQQKFNNSDLIGDFRELKSFKS